MKKYNIILKLSFVSYFFFVTDMLYWLDEYIINALCMVSLIYQLMYIIFLRKRENIKLGRSIAKILLYFTITFYAYLIYYYIKIYIKGYTLGFLMPTEKVYALEAWKKFNNSLEFGLIVMPILLLCVGYQMCYLIYSKQKNKKNS